MQHLYCNQADEVGSHPAGTKAVTSRSDQGWVVPSGPCRRLAQTVATQQRAQKQTHENTLN